MDSGKLALCRRRASPRRRRAHHHVEAVLAQRFFVAAIFHQQRIAEARVKTATESAAAAGVPSKGYTVEGLHAWEAILDHAKTQGCDLIVMASHGRRGMSALLLGSETQKVLTHSKLPVLVVR